MEQNQLKMLAARKEFPACLQNFVKVLEAAAEVDLSTVSQRHADQLLESSVSRVCVSSFKSRICLARTRTKLAVMDHD